MESVEFAKRTQFLLRKAVAHFVREDLLLGTYCLYDPLCIPISKLMCGWEGQEDMKQIDHKMLVDAFSAKGGTKEYCVPFWQVVGGEETDPDYDGYFIHVTNGERKSIGGRKERVYKIGCVKGEEDEPETIPDNNKHPLKDGSRMRDFTLSKDELWVGMRDELTEFLRERKGTEVHLKKGNTKKAQKAKLEKEKEENAKRSRPGTAKSADTAKSKESGTSPSKRWKRRRKKQQHTELRNKIEKKKEELVELLLELQKKLKEDETEDYRWMSVIKTLKVFIKHWTSIYFLAVTIKQSTNKQKNSLLSSYAESLIGHMSTRPLQEEYNILLDGDSTEQIEIPPTLYAQGQWILAFAASFFERHFNFLMHFDSKFGEDSYGHVARLYPERVFVMHRDIKRLEEGGWRYDPAFAEYLKVVAKFPSPREGFNDEIKDGGKAFFAYAEKVFFPCFRFHFNKHVASCVRTTTSLDPASKSAPNTARILPYMIGGHPDLARELLYWLNRAEDQEGIQMGDGDEDGVYDGFQHSFASREIVLDHNEGDLPPFKIKTDECMEYLTEGVDPIKMLQIPLIKDNKDLLWMMAFAQPDATVDIFDAETWTVGHDFEPVLNEVHKRVAPHCCHGQGVENHVQSAGHVRKTKVGEERGSHRGTAHSYLIRRFNTGAVQKLRSEKATAEEKKKIVRIWGRKRTQFFADYVDDFTTAVDKAAAAMDGDKYKALNEYIGSEESRQSTKETKELINKVKGGVGKKRKVTKSEMIGGVDVTADMDGGILFSILTKTNGHEPHVDAEIVQRGIESKLTLPLEETSIGEKLKLLKQVAKVEWIAAGRAGQTNFIIPQSDMMKSLFARQRELVAEKRAKKS